MTGSVESAKEIVKDAPKEKPKAARSAPKVVAESAVSTKPVVEPSAKPAAPEAKPPAAMAAAKPPHRSANARYAAVAAAALVVGTGFGMITTPKPSSSDGFAQVVATLESGRADSARLHGEIERLTKTVATLAQASEAARSEGKSLGASLNERMSKMEQGFDKKFANLSETVERAEREQASRTSGTTTPVEKRAAAPVPPAPIPVVLPAAKTEPTQTGSIADAKPEMKQEAKPKPEAVEAWALRDVYNGIAMLEDRRRRLIEVAPGDSVPGVGRVEAIERRGRAWVVVTRQGVITPQAW